MGIIGSTSEGVSSFASSCGSVVLMNAVSIIAAACGAVYAACKRKK